MELISLLYLLIVIILFLVACRLFHAELILDAFRTNDFPNRRQIYTSGTKLNGKTVVITGSNTGIGYATAKDFASRGARVIMVCRNADKAESAKSKIIAKTGNKNVVVMQCDLSDLESVQNFCKNFLAKESVLHILVNNAALGFGLQKGVLMCTEQKFEALVGTNYVGHFLLTHLLLDLMKKSAPSRVINVSSSRNYECRKIGTKLIDENGVKLPGMKSYPTSKLLNIIHAKELAKRLKDSNVQAYSVNPGYVFHGVFKNQLGPLKHSRSAYYIGWIMQRILSLTPKQGAQPIIYCALEAGIVKDSGKYFDNCKVKTPNKLALDDELCERVWDVTLEAVKDYTKMLWE